MCTLYPAGLTLRIYQFFMMLISGGLGSVALGWTLWATCVTNYLADLLTISHILSVSLASWIVMGYFSLFIANLVGFHGVVNDNRAIACCYTMCNFCGALMLMAIIVMMYTLPYQDDVLLHLDFRNYAKDINARARVNAIQEQQQCCGTEKYDYLNKLYPLPKSCCEFSHRTAYDGCIPAFAYQKTCDTRRGSSIPDVVYTVVYATAGTLLGLLLLGGLLAVIYTCILVRTLRRQEMSIKR